MATDTTTGSNGPSREWLEKMANAEDACPTVSAGVPHICGDTGDNATMVDLAKRLQVLRRDSVCHGELLATLCLPWNRESIRGGDPKNLDTLFEMIDTWREGHNNRMACIDAPQSTR